MNDRKHIWVGTDVTVCSKCNELWASFWPKAFHKVYLNKKYIETSDLEEAVDLMFPCLTVDEADIKEIIE